MIFVHKEGSEVHFLEESGIIGDIKFSFQTFEPTHKKKILIGRVGYIKLWCLGKIFYPWPHFNDHIQFLLGYNFPKLAPIP